MDLVGTLIGSAFSPGEAFLARSEFACRQTGCDTPACDAYTVPGLSLVFGGSSVPCMLYKNVTALVPNSGYTSAVLISKYS